MTQRQLAEAVDVTVSAVCQWERAKPTESGAKAVEPKQKHLIAIVEALGLTMSQFYGRVPKSKVRA